MTTPYDPRRKIPISCYILQESPTGWGVITARMRKKKRSGLVWLSKSQCHISYNTGYRRAVILVPHVIAMQHDLVDSFDADGDYTEPYRHG